MVKYGNRQKKILRDKIGSLSHTEHEEIYKILKQHQKQFTKNRNGVFFDFFSIEDEIIEEIENFVEYCIGNKVKLDEYDKQINECKISNCFDKMKQLTPVPAAPTASSSTSCALGLALDQKDENVSWSELLNTNKTEKISAFVNMLDTGALIGKKTTSSKFANAKKKYGKKVMIDKKGHTDLQYESFLAKESYVV